MWYFTEFKYRKVIANDLLPSAVEAIKRNVELNDLVTAVPKSNSTKDEHDENGSASTNGAAKRGAEVLINEGDAWYAIKPISASTVLIRAL